MKFLFKVWSDYDGFTPAEIPTRQLPGGLLRLGWARYIEAVERNSEIWVYFHGRHAFDNGVCVKGVAHTVDVDAGEVLLRVQQASVDRPLTDADATARIARAVAARGLQVFLLPEVLDAAPHARSAPAHPPAADATAEAARHGGRCPSSNRAISAGPTGSPTTSPTSFPPTGSSHHAISCTRAPTASRPNTAARTLFRRFKTGEQKLAFPLALGMREALAERDLAAFDAVVPIPLSPDKDAAGEIHRTQLLARELARLLGTPTRELPSLSEPSPSAVFAPNAATTRQGSKTRTDGASSSTTKSSASRACCSSTTYARRAAPSAPPPRRCARTTPR